MQFDRVIERRPFEGCVAGFEEAEIILLGAGYDGTASYRPGSRFAPLAIRSETLYSQENYSPYFGKDLTEKAIHDLGDIDLSFDDRPAMLKHIFETAQRILHFKKVLCVMGGEHLITLPLIQAALERYPDLKVVQIDAHLDLMDELFGERFSHGTVMRRVHDFLGDDRIYQVGVRSGSQEEFQFARQHNRIYPFSTSEFLLEIAQLREFPVYLSIDLDVFDPSLLPGTGTPEAGGIFFPEYIRLLSALRHLHIVACDIVELAPYLDTSGKSTIVASQALRELLIIL